MERPERFGRSHQDFYYFPGRTTLRRAGLLEGRPQRPAFLGWMDILRDDPDFTRMCLTFTRLVGALRIFVYRDFGFREPRPGLRLGKHERHDLADASRASGEEQARQMGG